MRTPKTTLLLALFVLGAFAAVALAASATVYNNSLTSKARIADMHLIKRSGQGTHCSKSLSSKRMRVGIGSRTTECTYSPPLFGGTGDPSANFTVNATAALSTKPSATLRRKLFTSVALRITSGGGLYRLDVYPQGKKWRLRKYSTTANAAQADSGDPYGKRLASDHSVSFINKPPGSNRLRIRIIQTVADGPGTLTAWINNHRVANVVDGPHAKPGDHSRVGVSMGVDHGGGLGGIGFFTNFLVKTNY
jgi:hypothetical protein